MNHTLLVGNGINRVALASRGASWNQLLQDLAARTGVGGLNLDDKPLPLAYEELVAAAVRRGNGDERKIKAEVGEWTRRIQRSEIHAEVMTLPIKHIVTTNYDYCLEDNRSESAARTTETTFSLFRVHRASEKHIWHIHGEAEAPRSLLLGHDQYVRYAKRIQDYLSVSPDRKAKSTAEWRAGSANSPLTAGNANFDDTNNVEVRYSWVDLFLRDHVHILGFGCDFAELIVWWLLTLKARKTSPDAYSIRGRRWPVGTSTLHLVETSTGFDSCRAKREVLAALGVNVKPYVIKPDQYAVGYAQALSAIADAAKAA